MKGYKAFEKGMICKGKQYAENTVFEEDTAEICKSGMHFCVNPLDVLNYYPLVDNNGNLSEFAEVESLDEPITDDGERYCTKKLKVGAKLSLAGFIKSSFEFIKESCETDNRKTKTRKKNNSKLAASGDNSKLAASGDWSKLVASGDNSKLVASGDWSKLVASGDNSKLAASGDGSKLAASGDWSKLAASGDWSKLAASGYNSQLAASGDNSKLAASGYNSKLAASGDGSQLAASGDGSQLAASGYNSKLAASGDLSQLELNGLKSVGANIGINGKIKGKKGNWIVLAEYDETFLPLCVKSAQIDGEKIKEDTFYQLKNGEFVEADE